MLDDIELEFALCMEIDGEPIEHPDKDHTPLLASMRLKTDGARCSDLPGWRESDEEKLLLPGSGTLH
jgi:hypothetical protein